MSIVNDGFNKIQGLFDEFFGDTPRAPEEFFSRPPLVERVAAPGCVTIGELVRRKVSHIRYNGRKYRVQVTEIEVIK